MIAIGLLLKQIPLQKDSMRLALRLSEDSCMFSLCVWWKSIGHPFMEDAPESPCAKAEKKVTIDYFIMKRIQRAACLTKKALRISC